MKHIEYLKRLFNYIESKGYTVDCECEGEGITQDVALTQDDDAHIYIIDKDGYSLGWIYWTYWNDWDESINDYTLELEKILKLDEFIEWNVK